MRIKHMIMNLVRMASQNNNKLSPKCNSDQTISLYRWAYEAGAGQQMGQLTHFGHRIKLPNELQIPILFLLLIHKQPKIPKQ